MKEKEIQELDDSLDLGEYNKQQAKIAAVEDILDIQRTPCTEIMSLREKLDDGVALNKDDFEKLRQMNRDGTASEEEMEIRRVLSVYFKYEESFRDQLTWMDIKATEDHRHILENAWVRKTMPRDDALRSYDIKNIEYAGYPEKVPLRFPRTGILQYLMLNLGFVGPNKKEYITDEDFESNKDLILKSTRQMAYLDARTFKDDTEPLAALNEELKYSGYSLSDCRKRIGPIQTTGSEHGIGKRKRETCYTFDKDTDMTLAKTYIRKHPDEREVDEDGNKIGPKGEYVNVLLSRLLPHYKKEDDIIPLDYDLLEELESAAEASAHAAAAAAAAAKAYVARAFLAISGKLLMFPRLFLLWRKEFME